MQFMVNVEVFITAAVGQAVFCNWHYISRFNLPTEVHDSNLPTS
jgi:hypothetical protein